MKPNSENLEFYKGQTIQRIISYQWQTSKVIYKFLFYIYLSTFAFPFYYSQMLNDTVDRPLKLTLLKICLVPIFIMLLYEITQLSTYFAQKRKENVSIYKHYGIVFVMLFFLYAIPELMGIFTYKSEQERLKKN